jgi:hydroxymethylpyrimidine pyrophosphatase-like HAD family hydrolase
MTLPIYFDIDGTLTDRPIRGGQPIPERIEAVRKLIEAGEEVVIWSANGTSYVRDFAVEHGLIGAVCIGKPDKCVDDNPDIRPRDRMLVLSPETYFT